MLVSIIMPVYNAEKYLTDSIESILSQDYINFEFLILNDGSTDNSDNIIRKYSDSRIKYISRDNKGLVVSLNELLSHSSGDYIARMDADDISLPSRIRKQVEYLNIHGDIDICGTWYETFGKNLNKIYKTSVRHEECLVDLIFGVPICHPSVMFRRGALDKNELLYSEDFKNCEDYELWSRLSTVSKISNIPEVLFKYRVHENQISVVMKENVLKKHYDISNKMLSRISLNLTNKQIKVMLLTNESKNGAKGLIEIYKKIYKYNETRNYYDSDLLKEKIFKKTIQSNIKYYGFKGLMETTMSRMFPIKYFISLEFIIGMIKIMRKKVLRINV